MPLSLALCCSSLCVSFHPCSAERNRQSAAASRERKKHHIKDLETRAARLSEEVARLQVADHERVRARVVAEERLQRENEELKREVRCWSSSWSGRRLSLVHRCVVCILWGLVVVCLCGASGAMSLCYSPSVYTLPRAFFSTLFVMSTRVLVVCVHCLFFFF